MALPVGSYVFAVLYHCSTWTSEPDLAVTGGFATGRDCAMFGEHPSERWFRTYKES
jgi:hypothetical protein